MTSDSINIKEKILLDLTKTINESKLKHESYYMDHRQYAQTSLEWFVEWLEGHLEACLNVDDGYCNLWYLESHSECISLMNMLYELTGNIKYAVSA